MGHLDGRRPADEVAIEGHEAMPAERPQDRVELRARDRLLQLGAAHPPAGVVVVVADADEPQEDLACGIRRRPVEGRVARLGAAVDRAGQAATVEVCREREHVGRPPGEQLAHRVLEQGERAGLPRRVGRDPLDQGGLDADAEGLGGPADGVGQLVRAHRPDDHGASRDGLTEAGVGQRPVEEVGAQRHHDAHRRGGRPGQPGQERHESFALVVIGRLGEQLLELVDDDEHLLTRPDHAAHDVVQRQTVGDQLVDDVGPVERGDTSQGRTELCERRRARRHLRDQPAIRACQRTGGEWREQTGLHRRGLAATRRTDHQQQALSLQGRQHLRHHRVTSEEVAGIGLLEGRQAAIRVARRDERSGRIAGDGQCGAHLGDELVDRRLPPRRIDLDRSGHHGVEPLGAEHERTVERRRRAPDHVVQQHPERVHVGRRRGQLAAEPLGRVVGVRGERDHPGADLVDAEIGDVGIAVVVEQDVLRPDPSVDDVVAVGRSDPGGDHLEQVDRCRRIEPAGRDALTEVAAAQQAADHHGSVRFPPCVHGRGDVRVLDPADALHRRLEATDEQRVADHARTEDPQRDLASDRRLVGDVHVPELASTDDRPQLVAGHRPLRAARHQGRQPIGPQRREPLRQPVADQLVDLEARVEPEDVEPSEGGCRPSRLARRRQCVVRRRRQQHLTGVGDGDQPGCPRQRRAGWFVAADLDVAVVHGHPRAFADHRPRGANGVARVVEEHVSGRAPRGQRPAVLARRGGGEVGITAGERELAIRRAGPPGVVEVDDEHRPTVDRRPHGQQQAPILLEDPPLEPLQLRRRLDPQAIDQRRPGLAVGAQRLRLPARAIQGEHVHRLEALPERVLDGQGVELVDDVAVTASPQIGVEARLDRREAELGQARGLGVEQAVRLDVGVRAAPPHRQGLAQPPRRLFRIGERQCAAERGPRRHRHRSTRPPGPGGSRPRCG